MVQLQTAEPRNNTVQIERRELDFLCASTFSGLALKLILVGKMNRWLGNFCESALQLCRESGISDAEAIDAIREILCSGLVKEQLPLAMEQDTGPVCLGCGERYWHWCSKKSEHYGFCSKACAAMRIETREASRVESLTTRDADFLRACGVKMD